MAEPTANIDIANPSEVARETLRRLALRRIAPTPDNYQALYEEITGQRKPATALAQAATGSAGTVLTGLVMDLNLHHPELSTPVEALDQAMRRNDWGTCRKQLGLIVRQLKQSATPAQGSETVVLLRELLAKTLEFGVVVQLSHTPALSEKAQKLAAMVREAHTANTLRDAASGLKSLWIDIDLNSSQGQDQQETLKRILLLLVENIGELLDDDTWLRGQLDMVQDVIAGPLRIKDLQEAERRLKDVIYKQGLVKHGLREATATLKAAMTAFVNRMGDVVAVSDDYHQKLLSHVEHISQTEDVLELNRILETLLDETRAVQSGTRAVQQELLAERDAALAAEGRILALEKQIAEMSALVREDPLTHSLNRRGMEDEFARETARAERYQTAFSIAVLDLDNFKKLNDDRGHQAGDEALIHLVQVAKDELRITDQVARLGGEEFLIMMPNTGRDTAATIVTRLQRGLTKKYFLDRNERVLITFSAGVAQRMPGESQEALIARADAAMFEAKRSGKNRVCLADDPVETAPARA
ncbi:MAG TPA: GGDEF domain-containing protein [Thiobacillus sp.]|nr:GGDEF domain-containing protein [Thiobacillus sp.]